MFLVNQKLSEDQIKTIRSLASEQEPVLFAIAGEISAKAKYGTTVLLATCSHLFTYDFVSKEVSRRFAISEIKEIFTKRMYGNGMMRLRLADESVQDLFRFTFSVAALCDAVRYYVKALQDGDSVENAVAKSLHRQSITFVQKRDARFKSSCRFSSLKTIPDNNVSRHT